MLKLTTKVLVILSANRQQGGVIGGTNINWDAAWDVSNTQR